MWGKDFVSITNEELMVSSFRGVHRGILDNHYYPNTNAPRPCDGFIYLLSGAVTYTYDNGETLHAIAGNVIFLPGGLHYTITCTSLPVEYILFDCVLGKAEGMLLSPEVFDLSQYINASLVFHKAFMKHIDRRKGNRTECISLLYSVYSAMQQCSASQRDKGKKKNLENVLLFIEDNYTNPSLSIKQIADVSFLSVSRFRYNFKAEMGIPPIKYINNLRLSHAKELIKHSTTPIYEVAVASGFSDMFYFSKLFKKETGHSPTKYRELYGAKVTI